MEWIKDRGAVLAAALGPRRYLLVPLFGAFVGFVDWVIARLAERGMGELIGVPSWAIGLFASLALITWWLLEYAVKLKKRISGARVELSRLRAKGVGIRNAGMYGFKDRESWCAWKKQVEDWERKVLISIGKVNEADAQWFHILDVVPPPRLPIDIANGNQTYDDHFALYKQHDYRVKRLGEMVRELWRE